MPNAETDRFRKNLSALCAEYGAVQEVATKSGISRVHLSRIIHGHSVPTLDVASQIADALGLSLSDMLKKSLKEMVANS